MSAIRGGNGQDNAIEHHCQKDRRLSITTRQDKVDEGARELDWHETRDGLDAIHKAHPALAGVLLPGVWHDGRMPAWGTPVGCDGLDTAGCAGARSYEQMNFLEVS